MIQPLNIFCNFCLGYKLDKSLLEYLSQQFTYHSYYLCQKTVLLVLDYDSELEKKIQDIWDSLIYYNKQCSLNSLNTPFSVFAPLNSWDSLNGEIRSSILYINPLQKSDEYLKKYITFVFGGFKLAKILSPQHKTYYIVINLYDWMKNMNYIGKNGIEWDSLIHFIQYLQLFKDELMANEYFLVLLDRFYNKNTNKSWISDNQINSLKYLDFSKIIIEISGLKALSQTNKYYSKNNHLYIVHFWKQNECFQLPQFNYFNTGLLQNPTFCLNLLDSTKWIVLE